MARHFTQETYVIFKRPRDYTYPDTDLMEVIKRDCDYPTAVNLPRNLWFKDETLPINASGVKVNLYSYMIQSEFDKMQDQVRKKLAQGQQITLF